MWEAIRTNKRKSVVLISVMGTVMILAGMVVGLVVAGPKGWLFGGVIAFFLWVVLAATSFYGGDQIFLASVGARRIEKSDHPTLYNIVEEMCVASGLSRIPDIYIVNDTRPNAFAVGRDPEHASVAVTAGLLNRLNRDEVQGVIAHELAHVNNRDILYVTIAGVMVGVIALLADVVIYSIWFSGGRMRSRSRGGGGGQAQAVILLVGLAFAILGPIAAQMLYFALSRRREYLADACGAQYTRYPEGLASALEKISRRPGLAEQKNRALAPMYIVNPMEAAGFAAQSLFSTHPPTRQRIRILRAMGGASLADYEAAYAQAGEGSIIPKSSLETARPVGVRPPGAEREEKEPEPSRKEKARETSDLLWRLNDYAFISCACGARLKVPPSFQASQVRCPRCDRVHDVPGAA
ncbi:MAG: M48 family metallopeptidase [Planctomycetota bacterium]